MLRRQNESFLIVAVTLDILMVAAAWIGAYYFRFHTGFFKYEELLPPRPQLFLKLLPIVILCNVIALAVMGAYSAPRARGALRHTRDLISASVLGWLAVTSAFYYYSSKPYSRVLLAIFFFFNIVALGASRLAVRRVLRFLHLKGIGVQRAVIIGTGRLAQEVANRLKDNPWVGFRIAYYVDDEDFPSRPDIRGIPVRGGLPDLLRCLTEFPVDAAFVAMPNRRAETVEQILDSLLALPLSVSVVPDFSGVVKLNSGIGEVEGLPVIQVRGTPISGWGAVAKRGMDLAGSILLLLVFAAPMLLLALLVKLNSPGPAFFRQERMGLGGHPFTMFKFRSMRVDAEHETGPVWASRSDPRRTLIGALMRRTSLDELPQLFNVLRGDMSLVGPRPERPHFVGRFVKDLPAYMLRLNVKAGLTGWAQINGLRGGTSVRKRLQYDLYYINHWSLSFDLLILLLTPFSGLAGRNAY